MKMPTESDIYDRGVRLVFHLVLLLDEGTEFPKDGLQGPSQTDVLAHFPTNDSK